MVKFELVQPKKYVINVNGEERNLNLITSTVTNKYHIITNFIEKLSKTKNNVEFLLTLNK